MLDLSQLEEPTERHWLSTRTGAVHPTSCC